MRLALIVPAMLLAAPSAIGMAQPGSEAVAPLLAGDWRGMLSPAPGQSIPLILHVRGSTGQWSATLDSPAQRATGLAIGSVTHNGAEYRFALTAPRADYVAMLSTDGTTLTGKWLQGGAALPLTLTRHPERAACQPDAAVIELPGLNHLFQTAATGQVAEYAAIEQTIAPVALLTVGDWIVAHTSHY